MDTESTSRARRRARASAWVWWDAVSSGRFLTWWSAAVALPMLIVVLPPYQTAGGSAEFVRAQLVSLGVGTVMVLLMLVVAGTERMLRRRPARGALILASIAAVSILRPVLNDAVDQRMFGIAADDNLIARILTNYVAWSAVLTLVAVTTVRYDRSRRRAARLEAAVVSLSDAQRRAERFERDARDLLRARSADLRRALDRLLHRTLDFEAVSAFSAEVREASHELAARSRWSLDEVPLDEGTPAAPSVRTAPVGFLARLRPPPRFLVGTVFVIGSAPFVAVTAGPWMLAAAVAVEFLLAAAADTVTRRAARHGDARQRGAALLLSWCAVAGIVVLLGAIALPDQAVITATVLLSIPGLAVVGALSSDAIHRSTVQARRLSRVLRDDAALTAHRTAATREPLETAADLLHGRAQGKCVILAARVDDEAATADDIAEFARDLRAVLDEVDTVFDRRDEAGAGDDLDETLALWGRLLTVTSTIAPAAVPALHTARVASRVAAIVNEGLVNAVKHASARRASVQISLVDDAQTPEPGDVLVRIATPGQLGPREGDGGRGGGLGLAGLGARTRLFSRGDEVILESLVALV